VPFRAGCIEGGPTMDAAFVFGPLLIFQILFFCGFGLVGLVATAFWIWMIIDVATNEPSEGNDKIVWLLVVILTQLIGALIYYFVRRPERIRLHHR